MDEKGEDTQSSELVRIFDEMREIQQHFVAQYSVDDIWSNSKIYEVLQANTLKHIMIPGHSGSLDAKDDSGNEYEYKHFKETSSNHSWTFNDYSDNTIQKLRELVHAVVFTHIDDTVFPPIMDWAYEVSGIKVAEYLEKNTKSIRNTRRMINVSSNQIETQISKDKQWHNVAILDGPYGADLSRIFKLIGELEELVGVTNILTSNKFWEVLVSLPLGHTVNSEQGGRAGAHDAFDADGGDYEYKVSKSRSWNFQDISATVLDKYLNCEKIVLAIVDKTDISVQEIWHADPSHVVRRLREKLTAKETDYKNRGKELRRLQVSLSAGDLSRIKAEKIY